MPTKNSINSGIPIEVAKGGTGAATLTDHGILLGSGTGAVTPLGVATDGQIPIGSAGNDPVLATLTAGAGIGIGNAAGAITITNTGAGAVWVDVVGTTQAMAVNIGYVANNAALVTLTLPDTAAFGSTVRVVGLGAGGWKIAQNAGETIIWDETASTTTGAGGSLDSTDDNDSVELLCVVADTDWIVLSSKGNVSIT